LLILILISHVSCARLLGSSLGLLAACELHSKLVDRFAVVMVVGLRELTSKPSLLAHLMLEEILLALEVVFIVVEADLGSGLARAKSLPFAVLLTDCWDEFMLVHV